MKQNKRKWDQTKQKNENTNQNHICFELSIRTVYSIHLYHLPFMIYACFSMYASSKVRALKWMNVVRPAARSNFSNHVLFEVVRFGFRSFSSHCAKFVVNRRNPNASCWFCISPPFVANMFPHTVKNYELPETVWFGQDIFVDMVSILYTCIAFQNRNVKNPSSEGNKNKNMRYAPLLSLSFSNSYDL